MAFVYDGQTYERREDIPDMGSLVCVHVEGNVREYRGLGKDFDKLPKYDNLATGSSCYFPDTKEYAEYVAESKTWYK